MKKYILFTFLMIIVSVNVQAQSIEWVSIQQAEKIIQNSPEKKMFIDFYTSWCGWCVRMDKTTFSDPKVAEYINQNYIPVKFNAESRDQLVFKNKVYNFIASGRTGVHSFAYFALQGKLRYPAYVVLNADGKTEKMINGYFPAENFLTEMRR